MDVVILVFSKNIKEAQFYTLEKMNFLTNLLFIDLQNLFAPILEKIGPGRLYHVFFAHFHVFLCFILVRFCTIRIKEAPHGQRSVRKK